MARRSPSCHGQPLLRLRGQLSGSGGRITRPLDRSISSNRPGFTPRSVSRRPECGSPASAMRCQYDLSVAAELGVHLEDFSEGEKRSRSYMKRGPYVTSGSQRCPKNSRSVTDLICTGEFWASPKRPGSTCRRNHLESLQVASDGFRRLQTASDGLDEDVPGHVGQQRDPAARFGAGRVVQAQRLVQHVDQIPGRGALG
jgi:hypothetical protein